MPKPNRPDSPCIGLCSTTYTELCRGCGRHFLEVANWNGMTDEEKEVIWQRLEKQSAATTKAGN